MKVQLGPVQKAEEQPQAQRLEVEEDSSQRSNTKARRGSIAKGRTLSVSEDDLEPQLQDAALTTGFLQGARVHLPVITEDNQGQEGPCTDNDTLQYTQQEKKLMLPSLLMGAKIRTTRRSSAPVELEISGAGTTRDLQPLPSRIPIPDKKFLRWQGKFDVLPEVGDHVEHSEEPILTNRDHLRHILKCHSIGVPVRITKQDYTSGHYAKPLFHCNRCLDQWGKKGRVPTQCTEPDEEVSGPQIHLGNKAFNYLKNIWETRLGSGSKKLLAEHDGEGRQLIRKEVHQEGRLGSRTESEVDYSSVSDSEFTSITDLSDTESHSFARYHKEHSDTVKASNKSKRRTKKRSKEAGRSSHGDVNNSYYSLHAKKRSKQREHKKGNRLPKEGLIDGEISTSSGDWSYDSQSPQVSKHDVGSGRRKDIVKNKKNRHSNSRKKSKKTHKDRIGRHSEESDSDDGGLEEHSRHDEMDRKHHGTKKRYAKGKKRLKERKHTEDMEGSEEFTVSEDEGPDEQESWQEYAKHGHTKVRRAKGKRRVKNYAEDLDGGGRETSEEGGLDRGYSRQDEGYHRRHHKKRTKGRRKHKKGRNAEGEMSDDLTASEGESPGEQDSWYDKDLEKQESEKRRRHRKKKQRQRKHKDEKENEELTESDYESPDVQDSWHDKGTTRYQHKEMKRPKVGKTRKKGKRTGEAEDEEELTESEDEMSEGRESLRNKDASKRKYRKARKNKTKGTSRKEHYAEGGGAIEDYTETESQDSSEREDSQHVVSVSSQHARRGHGKRRHSKRRGKNKKGGNKDDGSLANKSESETFFLPGRMQRDDMEDDSSSYEELLNRLIDDYEDEGTQGLKDRPVVDPNNKSISSKRNKVSQIAQPKSHSTRRYSTVRQSKDQDPATTSSQLIYDSQLQNSSEQIPVSDVYSHHARRPSQDPSGHLSMALPAGVGPGDVRSKRSQKKTKKPIVRNLMVKDRTGKPPTESGHLKENVFKTAASQSTASTTGRRPSVEEQGSSDTVRVASEADPHGSQPGGRRASVARTGARTGQTGSLKSLKKPSHQVLDSSVAGSEPGPNEKEQPMEATKRVRRMSKVGTDRPRRVGNKAYHSTQFQEESEDPNKNRRPSQIPRTTSTLLNTWASEETPSFRMNVGSRPSSSVAQSCVTTDASASPDDQGLPKMKVPPLQKLSPRNDAGKEFSVKPVAEVKPNVLPQLEVKTTVSSESSGTRSSSSSSKEDFEEEDKPQKHLVIPDFGGISSLSFTPAFTFSFYPSLIWPQQRGGQCKESTAGNESAKASNGETRDINIKLNKLNREDARKPKSDVTKLAIKMHHIVSNPDPIAKYIKKPLPKKARSPKKSTHAVSTPKIKSIHSVSSPRKRSPSKSHTKNSIRSLKNIKTKVLASCNRVTIGDAELERPESGGSGFKIEVCPNNLHEAESVLIQIQDYI